MADGRKAVPSDRQGFNRRWYAPNLEKVYTPTSAVEVAAAWQEVIGYGEPRLHQRFRQPIPHALFCPSVEPISIYRNVRASPATGSQGAIHATYRSTSAGYPVSVGTFGLAAKEARLQSIPILCPSDPACRVSLPKISFESLLN